MYLRFVKQIPNLFTLGNLSCGVIAIHQIFNGSYENAFFLVILAAILDFFDGFMARLLRADGEMGKQLDSMADLVTFGVAPSFMLYSLSDTISSPLRWSFILLAIFSAYRLAKFNIDTRQTSSFIGVPTPITGLTCMAWGVIDLPIKDAFFENQWLYLLLCLIVSLLLVSEFPMPSLKFKKGQSSPLAQFVVIGLLAFAALLFYGWLCLPIFYASYVLSSILINFATKR
ncbi:MAG: CDP-diacylglycerol--serine O-phosphatidyltransferase [Bacteroidia bacterium]|nr:CDP-diacylglycerol--serine O-phosphatidyltransferase [Bacteroidia bacterium]